MGWLCGAVRLFASLQQGVQVLKVLLDDVLQRPVLVVLAVVA